MYVYESYFFAVFAFNEIREVMALKQGQETHHSYMDGVRVKISENYKPPPRINPVTTYTQRILQNKQVQDSIPQYDFTLEVNVKEKMKELKTVRQQIKKEKRERLENAREERQRREEQAKLEKKRLESEEKELFNGAINTNLNSKYLENVSDAKFSPYPTDSIHTFTNISQNHYPPQAISSLYSHILTPIPLKEPISTTASCKLTDKSPLNISDFEADNSSPFDNIELKTINDLEELAQVLKNDESISRSNMNPYMQMPQFGNYTSIPPVSEPSTSYAMPNYNLTSQPSFVTSASSEMVYQPKLPYSTANGYYYPSVNMGYNDYSTANSYILPQATSYTYSKSAASTVNSTYSINSVSTTYKSVPDIMKALQDELSNVRVSTTVNRTSCPESAMQGTRTTESYGKRKEVEEEDEAFHSLPKSLQNLAQSISSMGFPLSRVVRACLVIGDDQKKVIEHLLAMSELLDLGFPEGEVSSALLRSNNDRDKALDILIS